MAGMGQDELLNNSAQLLRHSTLASLCRMCRTKERKGPLKIDGAYAWPVVQRAFDGFGEWNITRKPGWNVRSISVREQAKLGKSLSFEVCAGLHRHWLSQSELCVVMQNLKTSRKLRRGAMVMNTQGEGFCWLASESAPFTIEHKISTDGLSSALSVLGFIGRLDLSGDMHYPEGIREDPQVKQTLIDDRRAAQQQRTQQTKTKPVLLGVVGTLLVGVVLGVLGSLGVLGVRGRGVELPRRLWRGSFSTALAAFAFLRASARLSFSAF